MWLARRYQDEKVAWLARSKHYYACERHRLVAYRVSIHGLTALARISSQNVFFFLSVGDHRLHICILKYGHFREDIVSVRICVCAFERFFDKYRCSSISSIAVLISAALGL
jgi:hypothetical protein